MLKQQVQCQLDTCERRDRIVEMHVPANILAQRYQRSKVHLVIRLIMSRTVFILPLLPTIALEIPALFLVELEG